MSNKHILYGTRFSMFTGKVRPYLIYKNIPFEDKLSTLSVYKKIIIPKTGVRYIPVVQTPQNEYLQDTSCIIDELESRFSERPITPKSPKQRIVSYLFELYSDEFLVLPAMHYRWNKDNTPYIYEEFGTIIGAWVPRFIRAIVGKKLGSRFKGFVPQLGIKGDMKEAIEEWIEQDFLKHLDAHFATNKYLLGNAACLGDFALMGPLNAHLYRDPIPNKMLERIAPNVCAWMNRMNESPDSVGDYLANDEIPENLIPILKRMFKELWPVLESTVQAVTKQYEENPKKLPRGLGKHSFKIGETQETRAIMSFSQWKLQRVMDVFHALSKEEQNEIRSWLKELDAEGKLDIEIPRPVVRRNNRLEFVDAQM